jgi:alkanesulfonate monooxygenase SsuD/methylene tetrahydromethanopterin reductase-like flavin-dependent oxidoreductase (luciferase family)
MSEPGARRAARLGLHLLPQGDRRLVLEPWREELRRAGRRVEDFRVGIIRPWLVTDDRARDWPAVREAERYKARIYAEWIRESGDAVSFLGGEGAEPIPQSWIVGDADTCRAELAKFVAEYGLTDVVTWGVPPGVAPEAMNASLERFAREVMPALR